jgi:hypothetical protein
MSVHPEPKKQPGMQQGERYQCASCGCEIEVTKGMRPDMRGDKNPNCCCGTEMQLIDDKPASKVR